MPTASNMIFRPLQERAEGLGSMFKAAESQLVGVVEEHTGHPLQELRSGIRCCGGTGLTQSPPTLHGEQRMI